MDVPWLLNTRKDDTETTTSKYFLVSKGLSNDDVGGGKGHRIFRGYGRELVSKPAISLKNCWGGYRSKTQLDLSVGM